MKKLYESRIEKHRSCARKSTFRRDRQNSKTGRWCRDGSHGRYHGTQHRSQRKGGKRRAGFFPVGSRFKRKFYGRRQISGRIPEKRRTSLRWGNIDKPLDRQKLAAAFSGRILERNTDHQIGRAHAEL